MNQYFTPARRAFQQNLSMADAERDLKDYNFWAGLVALTSGLEVEIEAIKARLDRLEQQISSLPKSSE